MIEDREVEPVCVIRSLLPLPTAISSVPSYSENEDTMFDDPEQHDGMPQYLKVERLPIVVVQVPELSWSGRHEEKKVVNMQVVVVVWE